MLTFLFWNVAKKPVEDSIARLVQLHGVDVLILAESTIPPARLMRRLNADGVEFDLSTIPSRKVVLFTRFSREFLTQKEESQRFLITKLVIPGRLEFLLVAAHLTAKRYHSERSQTPQAVEFARRIRAAEAKAGHTRTVLVGDLNMNPFESGVVSAAGLHGVMTREIAERGGRTVQLETYPYFYNPMWSSFGDGNPGPPGTHYYARAEQETYFWNLFDQVLLRPGLLPFFRNDELRILTTDGTRSFLTEAGLPKSKEVSDHLPVLFRLRV